MESLESTETSRCGVIDLFPHPPGPLQMCRPTVTLTAACGGGVHPGAGARSVSVTHHGFASLGWLLTQRPVTSIIAVIRGHLLCAGARPRAYRPPSCQPSETCCRHHPHFSGEKTEAQGSWAACPGSYVCLGSARPCLPWRGISRAPQLFICLSPDNAQTETRGCTEQGPPTT